MTEFILPPILGLAAIGLGLSLNQNPPIKMPASRPVIFQLSHPIGTPASEAMLVAHPMMPAAEPPRTIRVVVSSPYAAR